MSLRFPSLRVLHSFSIFFYDSTSRDSAATASVTGSGSGVVTLFRLFTCSSRWSQCRCKWGKRLRSLSDSSEKADEAGAKDTASNRRGSSNRTDPAANFMSTVAGDGVDCESAMNGPRRTRRWERKKPNQTNKLIGAGGQGLDRTASSFKLIDLLTALPLEKSVESLSSRLSLRSVWGGVGAA